MIPRAVWVWSRSDRMVQIWVTGNESVEVDVSDLVPRAEGSGPHEYDLDFCVILLPRLVTPRIDEVALAALLVQCKR